MFYCKECKMIAYDKLKHFCLEDGHEIAPIGSVPVQANKMLAPYLDKTNELKIDLSTKTASEIIVIKELIRKVILSEWGGW